MAAPPNATPAHIGFSGRAAALIPVPLDLGPAAQGKANGLPKSGSKGWRSEGQIVPDRGVTIRVR